MTTIKGLSYPFSKVYNFVFEGDSETAGNGLTVPVETYPFQVSARNATDKYNGAKWANLATTGNKVTDMLLEAQLAAVDALYDATYSGNYAIFMGGINDIALTEDTDQTIHDNIATWVTGRKAAGFTVVVLTLIGLSTAQTSGVNTLLRADKASADILVDLAADTRLDDPTDVTYYQVDQIHLNAAGAIVVADLVRAALPK